MRVAVTYENGQGHGALAGVLNSADKDVLIEKRYEVF